MVSHRLTQNTNKKRRPHASSAQMRAARRGVSRRALHQSGRPARPSFRSSGGNRRPRLRTNENQGFHIPKPSGGEIVLTRRHFLLGAAGVCAAAGLMGGATIVAGRKGEDALFSNALAIPKESVVNASNFVSLESYENCMAGGVSAELPYGSLVWANDDTVAACLVPGEEAKPLTKVVLLSLKSGETTTVLEQAQGMDEGFEIYDVRANNRGIIWLEADILDGVWRIYTAKLSNNWVTSVSQTATLAEEGSSETEMPTLAAVGDHAFWQINPALTEQKKGAESKVKRISFAGTASEEIYSTTGRMATPLYACDNGIVITPLVKGASSTYQLTRLDAQSGSETEHMTLPSGMKPFEAGYGETGFMFSFDAIYNYDNGISNLGTYAPLTKPADSNYSNVNWLAFTRAPSAPPAWCGTYLMMKSTSQVVGINPAKQEYFTLPVESGADTYGDYLATTGTCSTIVTFSNINHTPLEGDATKKCLVRAWKARS